MPLFLLNLKQFQLTAFQHLHLFANSSLIIRCKKWCKYVRIKCKWHATGTTLSKWGAPAWMADLHSQYQFLIALPRMRSLKIEAAQIPLHRYLQACTSFSHFYRQIKANTGTLRLDWSVRVWMEHVDWLEKCEYKWEMCDTYRFPLNANRYLLFSGKLLLAAKPTRKNKDDAHYELAISSHYTLYNFYFLNKENENHHFINFKFVLHNH